MVKCSVWKCHRVQIGNSTAFRVYGSGFMVQDLRSGVSRMLSFRSRVSDISSDLRSRVSGSYQGLRSRVCGMLAASFSALPARACG